MRHDHPRHHAHDSLEERGTAVSHSTRISIVTNLVLTIVQSVVGWFSGSQGLIADSVHTLSDVLSDGIVLLINRYSKKDPDPEHPYGHYRFETAGSLVLGLLLLLVGGGLIASAFSRLQSPEAIPKIHEAALGCAVGVLLAKELLFRSMIRVAKRVKSTLLMANAWHARSDAASSLVVALGIIGNLLGYPLLDPLAALIVGFMMAKIGWGLSWNALHDLVDRSADIQEVQAIRKTLLTTPGVLGVHALRTRKTGDMIVVDVHLEVEATITVQEGHDIGDAAQRRVTQRHRVLSLLTHIDPAPRPGHKVPLPHEPRTI